MDLTLCICQEGKWDFTFSVASGQIEKSAIPEEEKCRTGKTLEQAMVTKLQRNLTGVRFTTIVNTNTWG